MNGHKKGTEAKNEGKMESMICGRKTAKEREREREREVGERVPALARKTGGGREKGDQEGIDLGRRDGWIGIDKIAGKRRKNKTPE